MKRLFGGLLLGVGILIMTGSGLCSIAVMFSFLASGGSLNPGMLLFPAIFGGIPFGAGFGLFYAGRRLLRPADRLSPDDLHDRFS